MSWRHRGGIRRIFGHDVFVLDEGAKDDPEPLLLLHGYPTSSIDFERVLPRLAAKRRVIVHDHLGFGLSGKPRDWSYSLVEQAEVALGVWRELGVTRGHLVAHDMGTSLATELLARRERGLLPGLDVASVTLSNGSIHVDMAGLRVSQKLLKSKTLGPIFAKLATKTVFASQARSTLAKKDALTDDELSYHWENLTRDGGRELLPLLTGYIEERKKYHSRWTGALARLDVPLRLVWGKLDPVAIAAIAECVARDNPRAKLTWLEDTGHFPMLEAPERWADAVLAP
jgi:pimeloyl-ACP methyl ester carboxylesterase